MNAPKNRQSEERNSQIASLVFVVPVVVGGCAAGPCGPGRGLLDGGHQWASPAGSGAVAGSIPQA